MSNPYQALLARALSQHVNVQAGDITDALEAGLAGPTIFHLHWEDTLYAGAVTEYAAMDHVRCFLMELSVFQQNDGRLVWTMHNGRPHEDNFPAASAVLRTSLAKAANVIHVHNNVGASLARDAGACNEQIILVRHPNLAPAYPDDISDHAARRYFQIRPEETAFAFIGAMREYKGLDTLVRAFQMVYSTHPQSRLILGGRQRADIEARYIVTAPGVILIPRYVDDAVMQYVLHATDFVVLPYRRILTSGALALAFGFSRPAIVPQLASLLEIVRPGVDALVFRPGDEKDLADTMLRACSQGLEARLSMRRCALANAETTTFADLAIALLSRLDVQRGDSENLARL
jgi:glycosyltransferase involved in cell wall biosynthesis